MIKTYLSIYFSLVTTFSFSQDVWIQRDSVNGPPRGSCASFTLKGEGFVVGGIDVEEFKRKSYSYDLDQDDWDDELALGGESGSGLERASAIAFSAEGFAYVGLGGGSAVPYYKDLWKFDDETDTWTQMADFPGSPRLGAIAFAIGHVGYVGAGQDVDGLTKDFYGYNSTLNEWYEISEFQGVERKEAVGFSMGSRGYVGTGKSSTIYLKDFWEYRPDMDEWKRLADLPGIPRMGAVGLGAFPSGFVALGEDASYNYRKDVWEYHYYGDIWTQRADFPGGGRTQASGFVVDNRIFMGLGYNGVYHDDFYEYDKNLSINGVELDQHLSIYPNPIEFQFIIESSQFLGSLNISFYSIEGKDVTSHFQLNQINTNKFQCNLKSNLPSGTYIVRITTENNQSFIKRINIK
ncbi:kelch repeat-containing protein [Crocinitomix catalasitica]|uniref:kelch repeat-containing protein n=1 Tax=Crocinitomix catalasitica TaxID=184607 RepID=UPI000486FB1A|nr:kelch repeat-containing protein [Crocinitomix catalasitica]